MALLKGFDQRHHFFDCIDEGFDLCQLGTDMHLNAPQMQVRHLGHFGIECLDLLKSDPEFVFVSACGDFGVGLGIHVGIDPDGNGGFLAEALCDRMDAFQFREALDVEGVDALLQCVANFFGGLAYPGKHTLVELSTGCFDPHQFSLAYRVKAAAKFGKRMQHSQIGVGFDRVAD